MEETKGTELGPLDASGRYNKNVETMHHVLGIAGVDKETCGYVTEVLGIVRISKFIRMSADELEYMMDDVFTQDVINAIWDIKRWSKYYIKETKKNHIDWLNVFKSRHIQRKSRHVRCG